MLIWNQKLENTGGRIFSFDFGMFCAILNVGRSQAACSSHKKVAQSTFSIKTLSKVERAQEFTQLTLSAYLERPLQKPNWTHIFNAVNDGCGRAVQAAKAAPAFFHKLDLGLRDLCAISGFSLTVRAEETCARLAAFVRPRIQKVRIC